MSLKDKLQEDWKQAMKSHDKLRAETISMAKAGILLVEKNGGGKLEDDAIIEILAREVKQRNESIAEFQKGKRQDLIDKTKAEIDILLQYLPQQLTEDEIKEVIKETVNQVGASSIKEMGKVMASVIQKTKGRADGKLVSNLVKEYLSR